MAVRYYDWITHHARRAPGKVAAIDLASERRLSYAGCPNLAPSHSSAHAASTRNSLPFDQKRPSRGRFLF
ncbi:hypothetical protein XH86_35180 [Bradyrhizobium guangdongense]|uniref:Uncharacterized protein n=1 Tax=Bradyrhizobium guangdongense TaxID=1325090 RepID=A0ABX6UR89_9BRAD|nr:hypothetical protein X265_35140 [Bradyrhizobium guangdongense]QOZ63393.1 hypothetical protein XH86_35180 [Bradyrhizobium guangdongense]